LENLDNLRMLEGTLQLGLIDEHGEELGLLREVRQDPLDDDDLLEPVGPALPGTKDLGHAAHRKPLKQLVAPEVGGCKWSRRLFRRHPYDYITTRGNTTGYLAC